MENRTELSIAESINNWKHQLLEKSNFTQDNINELESHLLDEIQALRKIGLNEEESFLVASKRIGTIEHLTSEFSKINRKVYLRNRILLVLKGMLAFIGFMAITELVTNTSVLIAGKLGLNNNQLNWLSIIVLTSLSITIFTIIFNKYKKEKINVSIVTNIPFLVITIIITKFLNLLSLIALTRYVTPQNFGVLRHNLNLFELSFAVLILILSTVLFYTLKKNQKLKLAE
jgi:hypothetical protein